MAEVIEVSHVRRPAQCDQCYQVKLALRQGNCWEATLPATLGQLMGWLKSRPYRKAQLLELLREVKNEAEHDRIVAEFEAMLAGKAQHILNELTGGTDSPLPVDARFKRTRNGNLFVGAGNIIMALKEAVWWSSGNPGAKRHLFQRLWVTPGKVVFFRENGQGRRLLLNQADGRNRRQIPPEAASPANMFRAKPARLVFPERIDYPAFISFFLFVDPERVTEDDLRLWLTVAGEIGLLGFHQERQGQFDIVNLHPALPDALERLRRREQEKEPEQNDRLYRSDEQYWFPEEA